MIQLQTVRIILTVMRDNVKHASIETTGERQISRRLTICDCRKDENVKKKTFLSF